MTVARLVGLGPDRWVGIDERSLPTNAAIAVVASVLLALNRLGGLVTESPRAFIRLTTLGVWGWLGVSVLAWLGASVTSTSAPPSLRLVSAIAARSYVSLIGVAFVLFAAAGLLEMLWPGRVAVIAATIVFMPATVIGGLLHAARVARTRAVIAGVACQMTWLATVGRELDRQLGHLY